MNRRRFFGLLAAAPVAIAAGPPLAATMSSDVVTEMLEILCQHSPFPKIGQTIQVKMPARFRAFDGPGYVPNPMYADYQVTISS